MLHPGVRFHQTPTASVRQMEWPASTIIHPRATANTMASVVAPSNSSNMRHCCGRPSVASYKARGQGLGIRSRSTLVEVSPDRHQSMGRLCLQARRSRALAFLARSLHCPLRGTYLEVHSAQPFCPLASRSRSMAGLRQKESAIVFRRATLPRWDGGEHRGSYREAPEPTRSREF